MIKNFLKPLKLCLLASLLLLGSSCNAWEAAKNFTTSASKTFTGPTNDEDIEAAVVSLKVTKQSFSVLAPWSASRPSQVTGSGFLVQGGWVVTNAHVVSNARHILLRRHGQERLYPGKVAFVAHDSDLALVEPLDKKAFAQGTKPLTLGSLPSLRSHVRTYGFPAGGSSISRTEGVVSRVEFVTYVHSGSDQHLAVQTDSAINPGNSGGPVVQNGKVIGVAFQVNTSLNDVGFFIPVQLVQRLLKDAKDGKYDGVPELGLRTSSLLNPTQRRFLGLEEKGGGVMVEQVLPKSSAENHVQEKDVLLAIDNHPISANGSILYLGHRIPFEQIVEEKQVGETVRLSLLREGKAQEVKISLSAWLYAVQMRYFYDKPLPHLIYSGLVFMPLNWDVMRSFERTGNTPAYFTYRYFHRLAEEAGSPPPHTTIVLRQILLHPLNQAYQSMQNHAVIKVNNVEINSLERLAAALETPINGFHIFELEPGGRTVVLNVQAAREAHIHILQTYGALQTAITPSKLRKKFQQQDPSAKAPQMRLPSITPPPPNANP